MAINTRGARWKPTGLLVVDGTPVPWWPLLPLGEGGAQLGVSSTGEWIVGCESGLRVDSVGGRVSTLPLLESDPAEVLHRLRDAIDQLGLGSDALDDLGLAEVVRTALTSGSLYWAQLSLDWVAFLAIENELRDLLVRAISEPWASQSFRHRAGRMLVTH
jgi:hypothetical protein